MDFSQLKYCLAAYKCGNFTLAAEECFVAQSSLSVQVAKLEAELGVTIFERTSKGVRPTEAGKRFLEFCRQVCQEETEIRTDLRQYTRKDSGSIFLGIVSGSALSDSINIIASFKKRNPNINLDIYESESFQLDQLLSQNGLDAALLTSVGPPKNMQYYLLGSSDVVFITYKSHPFALRHKVSLEEVIGETLIFSMNSSIKNYLENRYLPELRQKNPDAALHINAMKNTHINTNISLVASGIGSTLCTRETALKYLSRGICFVDIEPGFQRETYLVVSPKAAKLPTVKAFVKHVLLNIEE